MSSSDNDSSDEINSENGDEEGNNNDSEENSENADKDDSEEKDDSQDKNDSDDKEDNEEDENNEDNEEKENKSSEDEKKSDEDEENEKSKQNEESNKEDENEKASKNEESKEKKENNKENKNKKEMVLKLNETEKVSSHKNKEKSKKMSESNKKSNNSNKNKDKKTRSSNNKNSEKKSKEETKSVKNKTPIKNEKNGNCQIPRKKKNVYYSNQDNKRLETLMNFITESDSSEFKLVNDNNNNNDIKKENSNIYYKQEIKNDNNSINDYDNLSNVMLNDEINLLNEKVKYLEERNMRLDSLNRMYYDIIKTTNLDYIRNGSNSNNNRLNLQSLDYNQNYRPNNINHYYDQNDFMVRNYIDGERNKNINDFNNSMIDINKKITNYLIDNCVQQKEKNNVIEDIRNEIGEKLDKINKIQLKQKHDIDFIIKYGLNKNKSLDPIIGMLIDAPRPLPKLLRDDDEVKYKNGKIIDKMNITPFQNFSVYGKYSNKKNGLGNSKGNILRRSGSSIFEYNYKIDEQPDPHIYNHNIYPNYSKRPILEKVSVDNNIDKIKKDINRKRNNSVNMDNNKDDYDKERFKVYKGKFYLPAEFRFGCGITKKNKNS